VKWIQWLVLTSIVGNPILALLILIVVWWTVDRFTLGILPDPLPIFGRLRRIGRLQRSLAHNPHDRRARVELADLLVARKRWQKAIEVLRYNVEQGDEEARTYFLLGVALMGAGQTDRGAASLEEARAIDPEYGSNAIDLELGRGYLAAGQHDKAKAALQAFVDARHSTIEGKVLLARAIAALGDQSGAAAARQSAWEDYVAAPRFMRKRDRWWAWRAKPARPLTYAAAAAVGGAIAYATLLA
jgi:predicted Zn-dependent protease